MFAATLIVGRWASYDAAAALQRAVFLGAGFAFAPIAAALNHVSVIAADQQRTRTALAVVAGFVAAGIAAAWFLFPGAVNDNVGAGALALLLPFALGGVAGSYHRGEKGRVIVLALLALPLVGALVLMKSLGALAGLGAAALVVALLFTLGESGRRPAVACAVTTLLILFPAAMLALALLAPDALAVLGRVGGSALTRPALWSDMLAQLSDVPFTGSGLAATMMVDATYVRLLHVGFITHAHHLYLQVALEQGLAGLAAFAGIQAGALYLAIRTRALAVVAAITVLLVHGSIDAGLYAARLAPLLFFPVAALLMQRKRHTPAEIRVQLPVAARHVAAVAPVLLAFTLTGVRSTFEANLGAVLQARTELAHYSWPSVPIQDALRRNPAVDLAPAIARFETSLAVDPRNAIANRRLGQIELSRGRYDEAAGHLEAAFATAPRHRATRQLLGESYAIRGDLGQAASIWRTVDAGQDQLAIRRWWYEHIGDRAKAIAIGQLQEQLAHGR